MISLMCHDVNKEIFCNIFKKNRIIKEIAEYHSSKKIIYKVSFIVCQQQVVYK